MKIIHVAGRSGSGKTTFVKNFCPLLIHYGKVGTIKHLGHHRFQTEPGKDTTIHYQTGAGLSIGIDDEKMIIQMRSINLETALKLLADHGCDYAIIEGFKSVPFTKIIFGDLEGKALFREPEPQDIISHLDRFEDFHTLKSLMKSIKYRRPESLNAGYEICIPKNDVKKTTEILTNTITQDNTHSDVSIFMHMQPPLEGDACHHFFIVTSGSDQEKVMNRMVEIIHLINAHIRIRTSDTVLIED